MVLAAGTIALLHGRARASAADRKRLAKYNSLPGRKWRLGFDLWGYELRARAVDDSSDETEALEAAKYFWFSRGALRPDRGRHPAIVFRDAGGHPLFSVGMAWEAAAPEYKRTLFVFGEATRPVAPMKSVSVDEVRDL